MHKSACAHAYAPQRKFCAELHYILYIRLYIVYRKREREEERERERERETRACSRAYSKYVYAFGDLYVRTYKAERKPLRALNGYTCMRCKRNVRDARSHAERERERYGTEGERV